MDRQVIVWWLPIAISCREPPGTLLWYVGQNQKLWVIHFLKFTTNCFLPAQAQAFFDKFKKGLANIVFFCLALSFDTLKKVFIIKKSQKKLVLGIIWGGFHLKNPINIGQYRDYYILDGRNSLNTFIKSRPTFKP